MLRKSALTLLLLTSCGPSPGNNGSADYVLTGSGRPEPLASITLASASGSDCTARWNDETVTRDQLLERSFRAVERAVAAAGGVENITEATIPMLSVAAPASLRYACAGAMLGQIQRGGIPKVGLIAPGAAGEPAIANFPLSDSGVDTASFVVNIGPTGGLTWNGQAIDLAGLRARTRAAVARPGSDAPGKLAVVPNDAATYGSIYEVVRAVGEAGLPPMLIRDTAPPPLPR